MKVIVAGSRSITDFAEVDSAIFMTHFEVTEIVSGTAKETEGLF